MAIDLQLAPARQQSASQVRTCVVCAGNRFVKLFRKGSQDYLRCRECGLVVASPLPTPMELDEFYELDYQSETGGGRALAAEQEMARATARLRLGEVRRHARPESWLDVGCSTGILMEEVVRAGIAAEGIDISEAAVQEARARGLKAQATTLETFQPDRQYDVVSGFDVIEHVLDPSAFLKSVHALLRPGGIHALTTPDTSSLSCRLMGPRWYFYIPILHTFHFNAGNLSSLLRAHGFRVLRITRSWKALTYEYSAGQFRSSNPFIHRLWRLPGLLLPRKLRNAVFRVPIGEMMVIAQRM